jgi:malate dehydrogenase
MDCVVTTSELALQSSKTTPFLASQGYEGPDELAEALKGCDVVIIPAGIPRKPGMTRDDLFKVAL